MGNTTHGETSIHVSPGLMVGYMWFKLVPTNPDGYFKAISCCLHHCGNNRITLKLKSYFRSPLPTNLTANMIKIPLDCWMARSLKARFLVFWYQKGKHEPCQQQINQINQLQISIGKHFSLYWAFIKPWSHYVVPTIWLTHVTLLCCYILSDKWNSGNWAFVLKLSMDYSSVCKQPCSSLHKSWLDLRPGEGMGNDTINDL